MHNAKGTVLGYDLRLKNSIVKDFIENQISFLKMRLIKYNNETNNELEGKLCLDIEHIGHLEEFAERLQVRGMSCIVLKN